MNTSVLLRNPVIKTAVRVSRDLQKELYLVGGSVRDILMDRFTGKDIDFVVESASLTPVTKAFLRHLNGVLIPWHEDHNRLIIQSEGLNVTIDIARMNADAIINDLKQRDFTINAMAVNIGKLSRSEPFPLIDPYEGQKDILRKTVRRLSPESFDIDPLRLLRAFRFCRQFGFTPSPETARLIRQKAPLIQNVSRERINREFFSILHLPDASVSLAEMNECGLLWILFRKTDKQNRSGSGERDGLLTGCTAPFETVSSIESLLCKPPDVLLPYQEWMHEQLNCTVEESVTRRSLLIFTGFSCDISPKGEKILLKNNGFDPSAVACSLLENAKTGKKSIRMVTVSTAHIQQFIQLSRVTAKNDHALRRFLKDVEISAVEAILLSVSITTVLHKFGSGENPSERAALNTAASCLELLSTCKGTELYAPLLTGVDIQRITGIETGPPIGHLLKTLHAKERSGEIATRREAVSWIKEYAKISKRI